MPRKNNKVLRRITTKKTTEPRRAHATRGESPEARDARANQRAQDAFGVGRRR